jgi:homoserine kinase type II
MAVFTPVSHEAAKRFIERFNIGTLTHFEGIVEGVSNTNFRVETTKGIYALTLFEETTPRDDLPYFLGLTRHLALKNYPAPDPVADLKGDIIHDLMGRPCALIAWLSGRWPRHVTPKAAFQAGLYLAKLHGCAADFEMGRANSMGESALMGLSARCEPKKHTSERAREIVSRIDTSIARIHKEWPKHPSHDISWGHIHGDYFIDNVLMNDDDEVTGVIDYYYACQDFSVYDLAIALNAWGFSPGGLREPELYDAFQSGYESLRPLTKAEREVLPLMGLASAARFTLTRLYDLLNHDPSWTVKPKNPEAFFRRLEYWEAVLK